MSLAAGTQLGAHEIVGLLGAGGMGEVYRARDTKLNRQVAIKILPPQYALDPDRIARFNREAQAVAALNHPGIAAIYEFNQIDSVRFLVLELVEGDTLADMLQTQGAPGVEQALTIARDICAALEAAHEKGICHRDLKPANVKLTADGTVKVLDFGLAKILEANPTAPPLIDSPTMSLAGTYPGVILGTAGYMSPEQAKGFAADYRSDVFSLGCILYELLTGRRAFEGDTASEVLAAVLKTDPDLAHLPPRLNPRIVELLRRCLEKNPKRRWHAVADVRLELDTIIDQRAFAGRAPADGVRGERWRLALPVAIALIAGAGIAAFVLSMRQTEPAAPLRQFEMVLPDGQQLNPPNRALIALSPDGTKLAYHANDRLFLRELSHIDARAIAGTEGMGLNHVAFSPDGRFVAFYAQADSTLKRIAVSGGAAVTVCSLPRVPSGLAWSEHGILFANPGAGIFRVPASGGTPELLVSQADDETLGAPHMLPGGTAILFSVAKGDAANRWDTAQIVAQRLGSSERIRLIEAGSDGRYVPTGHLVYAQAGALLAAPFDIVNLRVLGGPVPVVEGIRRTQAAPRNFQASHYSFADDGSLAYVPGPVTAFGSHAQLALVDRRGKALSLQVPPAAYYAPRVSPDGRFIAVGTDDGREAAVWVYELAGGRAMQRLTFGGKNKHPIWSSDSAWVAFQSDREGDLGIFRQRMDGSGSIERLTKADKGTSHIPHAWSATGDMLYSVQTGPRYALWSIRLRDGRTARWRNVESAIQAEAVFSPDGRWVAYQSDETGTSEIYIQPAVGDGPKFMVPSDFQNHHPVWSPTGRELFYIPRQGVATAIDITTTPRFSFGTPTPIDRGFRIEGPPLNRRNHDLLPDGERFVGVVLSGERMNIAAVFSSRIHIVLNWFEELKQRVPHPDR